ncbi:hypothetical protein EDC56_3538 [Sinobacterium caligoides]|uniref:Uncharacterized protein n=1 Tax=Sinobacterium caligoides TaxID=933926 RepID=A0A3N2DDK4_9GAMM|nr:hypothetical protein [Sinobacterium caligoides]ROR97871.1 hypothetical protein EDC56_3538 [Sinobacterium caligoides]
MKFEKKAVLTVLFLIMPSIAYANGGGPLLLFISGSAFVLGQLWILFVETTLLKVVSEISLKSAFTQVFLANLISTVVVGLGFPLLLAVVTAFGMLLPEPYGDYSSAIGTWIYEGAPAFDYLGYISLLWLLVTFILTVFCERAFYSWYWRKSGYTPSFSLNKFIIQAHAASYVGLLVVVIVMWHELLGM